MAGYPAMPARIAEGFFATAPHPSRTRTENRAACPGTAKAPAGWLYRLRTGADSKNQTQSTAATTVIECSLPCSLGAESVDAARFSVVYRHSAVTLAAGSRALPSGGILRCA